MQKSQNILHYKGLGEVSYLRNPRARNLSIRINQRGEVRVTIPRFVSMKQAELFFLSKKEWVLKQLKALNSRECKSTLPSPGSFIQIRGKEIQVLLSGNNDDVEEAIWRILKKEAAQYLPGRVKELSERHAYPISGLKIRRMKTRWGSCTARKSINLNSWLVMLPEYLSDYVILHELVHTRVPDHSRKFWDELDGLTGGLSRQFRRELGKQQIMCFPGEPAD